MKTKLVRIGNSRGVRISKPLIEEAGLRDEVRLRIVESGLLIEDIGTRRAGWDAAAKRLQGRGEDGLLDEPHRSAFDESEWVWE
ncbi:MAG: AbrB/MazE/SpoVT family DNA-binding domain-containing protein [Gemmatimonadota bacterium]|nr:AbrB/MazE/SpoVT family DNA-binding domain-containing protein [Gemmatimonadota bacterium]